MRALVITIYGPQRADVELSGTHLRLRLFVEAIGEIADTIEILHLVTEKFIASHRDLAAISAEQSAYFGFPIATHLAACRPLRRETLLNHYLSGVISAGEQPEFFWFSGAEQAAQVGRLLDRRPDLVLAHRLPAMFPILRSRRRPRKMFFDLDDLIHRQRAQTALSPPLRRGKLGYLCHVPAIAAAERRGAGLSRATFVCSEVDRARLRRLGFPRVEVVPNAVSSPPAPPDLPSEPTMLFVGACWYAPNSRAAERLVRNIFPRIRAAIPEARLLIAGKSSLELPSRAGAPEGVEFLGYIENLAALYASARLICCPITSGSGTRVKLIEAAGYARPMVATGFAAEGLDFRDGVEILLRDDDDAIAAACTHLLRDRARSAALGMAARNRARQKYDACAIRQRIAALMSQTAAAGCANVG